jgi:hypothetical protein
MITLDWVTDHDAYEALLWSAGKSNLLQSWAYGEAKAEVEGWLPRRAILSQGTIPVAVAQVLEKRPLGCARIARVNRGPVWLDEPDAATRAAVLATLRRQWRWFRAGALFAAPEVAEGEAELLAGFQPRPGLHWCSAWIDLAPEETALRAALKGKWRNMLVGAEKAGLTIEVSRDPSWLAEPYARMQSDRGFAGVPWTIVESMSRHDPKSLLMLTARSGGQPVAAALLACHGAAATYLIGWSGDEGRKLGAANLLLWRAMLECKERRLAWFDLGGIDAVGTPGVAAFKRGMNGREYTLAGEFLSL